MSSGTPEKQKAEAGAKHGLDSAPASPAPKAKARKTGDDHKEQKTIDETLNAGNGESKPIKSQDQKKSDEQDKQPEEEKTNSEPPETKLEDSAIEEHERDSTPSNVLEKGIIYFFFRGRVGIDHPSDVQDLQRSYFILRPIPKDAKLGDGPIGDAGNSRLIAIPKKALPVNGKEKWICFVEKAGVSLETLKKEFLASDDYVTKTAGTRHTPAATPIGEGVYAITTTGRESHLSYILTLPEDIGEKQEEVGLQKQGSMVLSTKNPTTPSPQNTQLPQGPEYSKEILSDFRGLRWLGTQPKHLDVVNTTVLLIGESSGLDAGLKADKKDEKEDGKDVPMDEMKRLEEEDEARMKNLGKDDTAAIFADLETNAKNYPKLETTF